VFLFSGYYVFLPGSFAPADFIFAYGSGFLFLAILLGSKAYDFFIKRQKRFWYAPKEIDFVSDIAKFELMTQAAEIKRQNKTRTGAQRVSDFFF
jgi:amino acid transporter